MTDHPTAPVQDDDAVDDFLREIYGRAFKEGAESTIEQWASGSNDDAPEMPHKDCENEGAYQFIEDVKPKLSRLSPTPETGLVEALPRLIQDAFEEGVENGIDWSTNPSGEPMPQWIDSVARVELLNALSNVLPDEVGGQALEPTPPTR